MIRQTKSAVPPNTKTVIIQHEQPISIATAPSWQQNDENNIRSIINKEAKVQPIITKRPKAILWTVSNPISKTKLNLLYETKLIFFSENLSDLTNTIISFLFSCLGKWCFLQIRVPFLS